MDVAVECQHGQEAAVGIAEEQLLLAAQGQHALCSEFLYADLH